MQNIDPKLGVLVAADSQGTLKAIDLAILSELKLCTTLVEAMQTTAIPANTSQKLLSSMTSGLTQIVAGRNEMATTLKHLHVLKKESNLSVYDFGCPNGSLGDIAVANDDRVMA
jgi:hypothetical protein